MDEKLTCPMIPQGKGGKRYKFFQAAKWYLPVVGGIETVAVTLTEAVKGISDVKILACSEKRGKGWEKAGETDVYKAKTLLNFCSMPVSLDYLHSFRKMSKDADVIQLHAPFPLSDLALWLCGGRKKSKKYVWWHSDVVKQKKLMFFYKPLMKWMLRKVDGIFVASDSIIEQSSFLGKYKDKITVIPFGVDVEKYEKVEDKGILKKVQTDEKNVRVLFVGRLVYYKGVSVLLDAMKSTDGAELFIVGSGNLEKELKKQTEDAGLKEKVHFLGSLSEEELLSVLKESDVFVLPSVNKAECFGLVQLEAMACGKPVINTNLPTAVPEVSIDKVTGITVSPGDAKELADAINLLASDKELRKKYGENAFERCKTEYSLEKMQEEICKVYENKE